MVNKKSFRDDQFTNIHVIVLVRNRVLFGGQLRVECRGRFAIVLLGARLLQVEQVEFVLAHNCISSDRWRMLLLVVNN